jgi:hypothetical protein
MVGWVGPGGRVDALEKKILLPVPGIEKLFLVVEPVAWSLYWLSYPGFLWQHLLAFLNF